MSGAAPRVALLLVTVGDLSGSGGTERQFASLFEHLRRAVPGRTTFITAQSSLRRLQAAGLLRDAADVVALPLGEHPAASKAGIVRLTLHLFWQMVIRRFDVVHICQPTPSYLPFAAAMTHLPRAMRPAIATTIVDCTLTPNLIAGTAADLYERQVLEAHHLYFRLARLDGVYAWYRAFVEYHGTRRLLPDSATVTAARYCFTDPQRFVPGAKDRLIVHAGRLSEQKRPLLFVDAIAELIRRHPELAAGWKFAMYGRGPLGDAVTARIAAHGLARTIELTHAIDMAPVFARSRLYVSTQAFENFTSLAMLEAMAAGNAVVAANVGQTAEFVRPDNGVLAEPATAEGFADAIADYLRRAGRHDAMAAASRRIATEEHTIEHFASDITAFWSEMTAP